MRLPLEVLAAIRGGSRPRLANFDPPLPARVHLVRLRPRLRPRHCPDARGQRAGGSLLLRRGNVQQLLDGDPAGGGAAARLQRPERCAQARDPPLPVVAFGRIKNPLDMERVLQQGDADLIGMARQLIADPELANKVRDGRLGEVRPCIASNACLHRVAQRDPVRCALNPAAGQERRLGTLTPATTPRRVAVAGGGPAGLSAAVTLAQRGHPRDPVRAGERARRPHPARGAPAAARRDRGVGAASCRGGGSPRGRRSAGCGGERGHNRGPRPRRGGRRHRLAPLHAGARLP